VLFLTEFLYFFLRFPPITWILEWILEAWQVNDVFPQDGVDAMAVISYAANKDELTYGSCQVALMSRSLKPNQDMLIGWGTFAGPTQETEERLKRFIFRSTPNVVYVNSVTSSTDECKAILEAWVKTGKQIRKVGVAVEGAHSRRDRLVWMYLLPKYFPNAKLFFRSVDARQCADKRNPMYLQRYWQVWLVFNICFYPLYRWFPGVAWFAKKNFHQASS
jgi:hypothetical protein